MADNCSADHKNSANSSHVLYVNQKFTENMVEHLRVLKNQHLLFDICLRAISGSVRAHKIILACASKYFREIFFDEQNKNVSEDAIDFDVERTTLEAIVNYCYSGKIDINVNNVGSLQAVATKMQIEEIVKECNDFLEKNIQSCKSSISASLSEIEKFISAEMQFVNRAIANFMEVYDTIDFLTANMDTVVKIIKSNDLNVPSESCVFDAVKKWILYDLTNREQSLELFEHIRFPLIPHEYLFDEVAKFAKIIPQCYIKLIRAIKLWTIPLKNGETYPATTIPRKSTLKIFAVGSWQTETANKIQLYDRWDDHWYNYFDMKLKKIDYGATMHEEKLYIIGGWSKETSLNTVEVIDLKDGSIVELPPMNESRHHAGAIVLEEGSSKFLYAIGGRNEVQTLQTVEKYDFVKNKWSYAPPMINPRDSFGIAKLHGEICVAGGRSNARYLNDFEMFNPIKNLWSVKASLNVERGCCSLAENDGILYAFGGYEMNQFIEPLSSVEKYNAETDSWSDFSNLPSTKGAVGTGFFGNFLIAVGGRSSYQSLLADVDLYDISTKQWKYGKSLNVPSDGVSIFSVPWKLINNKFPIMKK